SIACCLFCKLFYCNNVRCKCRNDVAILMFQSYMDYKNIAYKIIELKNADLALRDKLIQNGRLSEGYNEDMQEMHNKNAKTLNDIIETIGYPTIDKIGKEASEATWLIIQHSIGQPEFMKKFARLLEIAVNENKADPKNLAYLTD